MSDQAESQRTRNCTRPLYMPISTTAMTTRMTRKMNANHERPPGLLEMTEFRSDVTTNTRNHTNWAGRGNELPLSALAIWRSVESREHKIANHGDPLSESEVVGFEVESGGPKAKPIDG